LRKVREEAAKNAMERAIKENAKLEEKKQIELRRNKERMDVKVALIEYKETLRKRSEEKLIKDRETQLC